MPSKEMEQAPCEFRAEWMTMVESQEHESFRKRLRELSSMP